MAQLGRRVPVRAGSLAAATDPNFNLFTATLAQNAALVGRIALPAALGLEARGLDGRVVCGFVGSFPGAEHRGAERCLLDDAPEPRGVEPSSGA